MFRKLTSMLYQTTQQQLMSTYRWTQHLKKFNMENKAATAVSGAGDQSTSITSKFLKYETPTKSEAYNKKITIVGSEQLGIQMALKCFQRELQAQIFIMDYKPLKEAVKQPKENISSKEHLKSLSFPLIKTAADFPETRNSDLIIVTKDTLRLRANNEPKHFTDILTHNTNILKNLIPNLVKYSPNTVILIDTEQPELMSELAWRLSCLPKYRILTPQHKLFQHYLQQNLNSPTDSLASAGKDNTADIATAILENYQYIMRQSSKNMPQIGCENNKDSLIYKAYHITSDSQESLFQNSCKQPYQLNYDFEKFKKILI